MSHADFVMVIDPLNFGGKLRVPLSKTFDTKGRNDYLRGLLKKDLSLCCLFQRGKCHAGAKCHQVHADRNFVAELRAQCSKITSCCLACGDTASSYPAGVQMFSKLRAVGVKQVQVNECTVPVDQIAFTVGLGGLVGTQPTADRNGTLHVPVNKICRLHLRGSCKYGKDCKNVHLCSKLGERHVLGAAPVARQVLQRADPKTEAIRALQQSFECMHFAAPPSRTHSQDTSVVSVTPAENTPNQPPIEELVEKETSFLLPFAERRPSVSVGPRATERRHSFGNELDEDEDDQSLGNEMDQPSSECSRPCAPGPRVLFNWTTPPQLPTSPVPTCVASASLRKWLGC